MGRPLVSVIIPTKNSANVIVDCIKSVLAQTYKPIQIIVVDNRSSDLTRDLCLSLGAKVYVKGPERSTQRNFGAKVADGEYILFLDSDMIAEPYLIQECIEKCNSFNVNACVISLKNIGTCFWTKCVEIGDLLRDGDTINIAPRFMSKDLFLRIGGYDESLIFGEDKDLYIRMLKADIKMITTNSFLYHIDDSSLKERTNKLIFYGKNLRKYYNKHKEYTIYQLFPLSLIYFRNMKRVKDSLHFLGFIFLKILEYAALLTGVILQSIEK